MKMSGRLAVAFLLCALSLVLFVPPTHAGYVGMHGAGDAHNRAVRVPERLSAPSPLHLGSIEAVGFSSTSSHGPLRKSQFLPPRHELAASAILERRGRSAGVLGLPRAHQNFCSDAERRTLKEAERASRSALLFAMRSYDHRFINDITEGGKNVVRAVLSIKDWTDAIPSVTTD